MFSVQTDPIDCAPLLEAIQTPEAGAVATFEGRVRNQNDGRNVRELEYEGYEEVALKEGETVVQEAIEKFKVERARCVHRVGHLHIGDIAVWVGVSAGHRGDAFAACKYIIDEIKHRLPIWKKEYYAEGDSGWINCVEEEAAKRR